MPSPSFAIVNEVGQVFMEPSLKENSSSNYKCSDAGVLSGAVVLCHRFRYPMVSKGISGDPKNKNPLSVLLFCFFGSQQRC